MKYVLIRDDDISYFTDPATLETLYSPLLQENKPINISVIPNVAANIRIPADNCYVTQENLEYDPLIPPKYRGIDHTFPLNENPKICNYLKSLDNCEILQHGNTHRLIEGLPEFQISDKAELQRNADEGRKILEEQFGKISFFAPPWDVVSAEALRSLKSRYLGISLGGVTHHEFRKSSMLPYLAKKALKTKYMFCKNFLIVEHGGNHLSRLSKPKQSINKVLEGLRTKKIHGFGKPPLGILL